MAAYRGVDGLKSPAVWLPVHRDQLQAQHTYTQQFYGPLSGTTQVDNAYSQALSPLAAGA